MEVFEAETIEGGTCGDTTESTLLGGVEFVCGSCSLGDGGEETSALSPLPNAILVFFFAPLSVCCAMFTPC